MTLELETMNLERLIARLLRMAGDNHAADVPELQAVVEGVRQAAAKPGLGEYSSAARLRDVENQLRTPLERVWENEKADETTVLPVAHGLEALARTLAEDRRVLTLHQSLNDENIDAIAKQYFEAGQKGSRKFQQDQGFGYSRSDRDF